MSSLLQVSPQTEIFLCDPTCMLRNLLKCSNVHEKTVMVGPDMPVIPGLSLEYNKWSSLTLSPIMYPTYTMPAIYMYMYIVTAT